MSNSTPDDGSDKGKAGKDGWSSDSSTVERRDRETPSDRPPQGQKSASTGNRPIEGEQENQASLPDRGETKE